MKTAVSMRVSQNGQVSYVVTEAFQPVQKEATIVLGSTDFSGCDEDDVPEGVAFDEVIGHIDREIRLKTSCKSLPYSVFFYMCFIWSAWLKCDTYNFGVGSSVQNIFNNINIDHDFCTSMMDEDPCQKSPMCKSEKLKRDCKTLIVDGQDEESRNLRAGGGRGGKSDMRSPSATFIVVSHETLWGHLQHGLIPLFWYEGTGRVRRYHKIIGGIRLRQTRATVEPCVNAALREWYSPPAMCRGWTGISSETYGINATGDPSFIVSPLKEHTFEVRLPVPDMTQAQVQARMMDLWNKRWLDFQTQKVVVELGIYNGDVDAYAYTQDEYQFRGDGSVYHRLRVATANNLFRRWYYFAADVMVWLLISVLLVEESIVLMKNIRNGQWKETFFGPQGLWNCSDWGSIILGIVSLLGYIVLDLMRDQVSEKIANFKDNDGGESWSFALDELASLIDMKKHHEVVLFFFALCIMVRFFKAFRGQPRLAVLSTTFAMCCQEVMYFFVIFVVIFSNFVVTGFLLFNSQIEEWSTLAKATNECFKILMGEFEFAAMYSVHPFAASLWFWSFMVFVLLITLSMLLAVILETYSIAKVELGSQGSEGFITQIYYLVLQSRFFRWMVRDGSDTHWKRIEKVQEDLSALEQSQRLALAADARFFGRPINFKVTLDTFDTIGVPKGQQQFFWKVFKTTLEQQKKEADQKSADAKIDENVADIPELESKVAALEKRLASQESGIRNGLKDVLTKLDKIGAGQTPAGHAGPQGRLALSQQDPNQVPLTAEKQILMAFLNNENSRPGTGK